MVHNGIMLMPFSDNSKGLLLVTLVTSMLSMASSDAEKLVLYRLLNDAAVDIPEVLVARWVHLRD